MALKILFADDSVTAQNLGKKILTDAGYEVIAVSNGAAALKKINELKPEIVVLDVYMPGYTGLEVCEKLRAAHETAKMPVLLTVGKMEAYKPEEGARVKADGVIIKPFEASDLLASIEKLAGRVQQSAAPKAKEYQKTVIMQAPAFDDYKDASYEQWKSGEHGHDKPTSTVSVPSEMASHAAFGFDEDLLATPSSSGPSAEAAPAVAAESQSAATYDPFAASAPAAAEPSTEEFSISSAPATSEEPSTEEFKLGSVESASGEASGDFSIESQAEESSLEVSPAETESGNKLLDRFDAILAGSPLEVKREAGYESTAFDPTPDAPIASEAGLDPTIRAVGEVEVTPEPILETFSGTEAENADTPSTLETEFAGTEVTEAANQSADEVDEFEARVNAAMSSFEQEGIEIIEEPEVAPAIAEREAEEVELSASKNSYGHEVEHAINAAKDKEVEYEIESTPEATASSEQEFELAQQMHEAISELPSEAAPVEESEQEFSAPVMESRRQTVTSAEQDVELAKALAAAVGAEAQSGAVAASARATSNPRALRPEVISKIVSQVLERSLPEILSQVMRELEREREE